MQLGNSLRLSWQGYVIFVLTFLIMFFFYGIHETMFDPPQSVHVWRQTNCLSLTQNYYQDDLPFFKPEMHNQFGNDGISGKAVGEFPIIYFTVAQLWDVFGKHIWIFRLVQIIIFFLGLLALFYTLSKVLKNQIWAGFISLLVFTSPMIAFYGPNFLPDVPALSFVFIAWFYILKYTKSRKTINLWMAALFFCLSMLLKITSAISFTAFGGWIIIELVFLKKEQQIFKFNIKHFIPFVLALIVAVAWYVYADLYNTINKGHFSFHGIWPIWEITKENFDRVIEVQRKIYFKQLFLPFTQFFTIIIWIVLLLLFKKLSPILKYFVLVLPVGFLLQVLFWFQILDYHDYYMINLIVVLVAVWIMGVFILRRIKMPGYINYPIYILITAFFMWNVLACKQNLQARYQGWMNAKYVNFHKTLIELEPYFKMWGIKKDDKVISLPDSSINATLYYMNRKGYTTFGSDFTKRETFYKRIEQGAKYLIVNDSTILTSEVLQPFIKNKIGEYENILVYDLRDIKPD